MTTDCPRFCAGCPIIPPGLTVELVSASQLTMAELRRFKFARDAPELAKALIDRDLVRVEARVVESDVTNVDIGDTARQFVSGEGRGPAGTLDAVRKCPGPQKTSRFKQVFGLKVVCGSLKNNLQQG